MEKCKLFFLKLIIISHFCVKLADKGTTTTTTTKITTTKTGCCFFSLKLRRLAPLLKRTVGVKTGLSYMTALALQMDARMESRGDIFILGWKKSLSALGLTKKKK